MVSIQVYKFCFFFNLFISSLECSIYIAEVVFAFPTSRKSHALEIGLDASLLLRAFLIGGLLQGYTIFGFVDLQKSISYNVYSSVSNNHDDKKENNNAAT